MYLRVQMLGDPHRTRLSRLLVRYANNRIVLATAVRDDVPRLLAENDRALTELGAATAAAFDSVASLELSTSLLEAANGVFELDAARKSSRLGHVPTPILIVLSVYIVAAGGVLGYVLEGYGSQLAGTFLITLLTFALVLIIDLERPTNGNIVESQVPMVLLRESLISRPPEVFDRWRGDNR
jgi:hypothetical protein